MTTRGTFVGDVLIEGDLITEVAEGGIAGARDARDGVLPDGTIVVDATGMILMPGLIDSHVHGWEAQLRGLAPDADFGTYMELAHDHLALAYRPEDLGLAEELTAAHAINAGTTTIVDNSHNTRTRAHADAAVEALLNSGIRAVYAAGPAQGGQHEEQLPGDLLRLRDSYFADHDGLVSLRLFELNPNVHALRFAADNGIGVSGELGGWVPGLDELAASGLVGPDQSYNHCAGLPDSMWRALADGGAAVNLVPRSDAHYGLAAHSPVLEAARHGIQIGISSDNELSYGHDLFTEMRVLLTMQRGLAMTAAAIEGEDPVAVYTTLDVLRAATIGGALNAGLAGRVGAIEAGYQADVVLVRTDQVHTRLRGSAVGTIVNFAGASDVDTVFVGGSPRKWRGQLVGVDYGALADRGAESRARILAESGVAGR